MKVALLALIAWQAAMAQNLLRPPTNPPSNVLPAELRGVGIDQKLNGRLPLDLHFRDENGRDVRLGEFFGARPVIVTPFTTGVRCCARRFERPGERAQACLFQRGGAVRRAGGQLRSIGDARARDPEERRVREALRTAGAEKGFHFLTGDEPAIKALTGALGFRYTYDPKNKQFAHASGVMITTPEGRISRYLYGVDYAPRDLRLALVEAAEHKIGSPVDELLLFCYHYDPATGKYGAIAMSFLRLAAAATVLGIATLLTIFFRREFRTS